MSEVQLGRRAAYYSVNAIAFMLCAVVVFSSCNAYANTLFRNEEVRATNLKPFPKWTGVMDRYFSETKEDPATCKPSMVNHCGIAKWKEFLAGLKGKSQREQMQQVQHYVNEAPYILDPVNWGMPDYWATPKEFFIKDGDCEDYAITKFMSLIALGFNEDDMRVVILQDLNLNLLHSILVVYVDGTPMVLDNQLSEVVSASSIRHYKPIYAVNEKYWWRYRQM